MQVLHHAPEFVARVTANSQPHSTRPLASALAQLCAVLHSSRVRSVAPTQFVHALPEPYRSSAEQQDVGEFAKCLFATLEREEGAEGSSAMLWTGKSVVVAQCGRCGQRSESTEAFTDLTLSLPADAADGSPALAVQALVDALLVQPEAMVGDNQYFCARCAALVDAQRWCHVVAAPRLLMLTVARWRLEAGAVRKDPRHVALAERLLLPTLERSAPDAMQRAAYTLFGAVSHSGSAASSGHYVAHCRCRDSGEWQLHNDAHVRRSSFAQLQQLSELGPAASVYCLFYERDH